MDAHLPSFACRSRMCPTRLKFVQESYTPIDHITNWKENQKSAYFSKTGKHVIHHPGEVRADHHPTGCIADHSSLESVLLATKLCKWSLVG